MVQLRKISTPEVVGKERFSILTFFLFQPLFGIMIAVLSMSKQQQKNIPRPQSILF